MWFSLNFYQGPKRYASPVPIALVGAEMEIYSSDTFDVI